MTHVFEEKVLFLIFLDFLELQKEEGINVKIIILKFTARFLFL